MKNVMFTLLISICFGSLCAQNVGIGTSTPAEKLDITGNMKLTGEIKPGGVAGQTGQVLTSNGNGTMQWSMPATGTEEGNGGWGDCSIYNIESYQPVANGTPSPGDYFGEAVAISGDYAIVGASLDDDAFNSSGSATIFKFNATTSTWESQGKIFNPNAAVGDRFGIAVGISGDYAIVGAIGDTESGQNSCGSATIFKRNVTTGVWESQGKLLNPNFAANDFFGYSVAISGDYAMVGTRYDDENGFSNCGSVTFFKRNTSTGVWESQGKQLNASPANDDLFGYSVAMSGIYAIVGSKYDDENSTTDVGSATIYKRNVSTNVWTAQPKLSELGGTSYLFGTSVSIKNDYAIIGAIGYGSEEGAASVYKRNTSTDVWEFQMQLFNPFPMPSDQFGSFVDITADYAMVGSVLDDENGLESLGTVTIFHKIADGIWLEHQKFSCPAAASFNLFGSVALNASDNRFVVGAYGVAAQKGAAFFGKIK